MFDINYIYKYAYYLPDYIIGKIINYELGTRLSSEKIKRNNLNIDDYEEKFIEQVKNKYSSIAIEQDKANEQHYMVPPEYYSLVLGPKRKYSCSNFEKDMSLSEAEIYTLEKYCDKLDLKNQTKLNVLDMGCGWGSFSLYASQKYPQHNYIALSNSSDQKKYIDDQIESNNIQNLKILTLDVAKFDVDQFINDFGYLDRVISIEMFEHMKRYDILFDKINCLLNNGGKIFIHIFTCKKYAYEMNDDSWMGRLFFSGGTFLTDDLLPKFTNKFKLLSKDVVNGENYGKTAQEWLTNHYNNREKILEIFEKHYTTYDKYVWYELWRIFYLATMYCFNYNNGNEWHVCHYLFEKNN